MSLHDKYFSEARYTVGALDVCMCSMAQVLACIAGSLLARLVAYFAMASDSAEPSDSAERQCPICQLPLHDGTTEESLPCAHTFHECCLNEYALSKNVEKAAVPCPVCRAPAWLSEALPESEEPDVFPELAEPAVFPPEPEVDFEPVVAKSQRRW